eukprot:jgi/Picre1/32953/NNA_008280.t1
MLPDAHGEVKYNCWEKPTQIAEWKEEHIVIAVLAGWGIGISTALKVFGGRRRKSLQQQLKHDIFTHHVISSSIITSLARRECL